MDAALVRDRLRGTSALLVGLVGPDGQPHATRGWGLVLAADRDGPTARVIVDHHDRALIEGAAAPRRLAVTATEVRTLRSVQLKGAVLRVEDPAATDVAQVVPAYVDEFFAAVQEVDDFGRDLMERWVPAAFAAVTMRVEQVYDQTPGPQAGRPVDTAAPAARSGTEST